MIQEFKFETQLALQTAADKIKNEFEFRGYKPLWSFLAFGLKFKFGHDSETPIQFYFKSILFVIPIWYTGVAVNTVNGGNKNQISLYYYTKGIKLLDIFRIGKRWRTEAEDLQKLF
ncbi:MAG: hypothetical protein WA160_12440 [Pseudobdellovibrio sp.]